ncbi:hypothetical protein DOY81_007359 [Sarcophaga bullata]|nr:hypothetical protein DOY81_007359 [Sarcophaga bullata]
MKPKSRSMAGLKALGLLLIIGCLAVSAEVQEENKTKDVPRAVSEQDVRLLLNPLITHILAAKTSTARPPPQRDPYHYHHPPYYYPYYYPYGYPHHYPYPPHHNHTYPPPATTPSPTKPTKPTPPTKVPPTEDRIPFYHPNPYYPPYYPPPPPYHGQPPVIVIVSPTTPAPVTGGGTGGNNAGAGTGNGADADAGAGAGADPDVRYTFYPRTQTEHIEEEPQYDYVDMSARNVKHDAVSVVASDLDEEKDKDTFIVDTKDIKLPFGITINSSSGSSSDKKNKEQEALIYLRNYKAVQLI